MSRRSLAMFSSNFLRQKSTLVPGRRGRLAAVAVPETAMDEQDRLNRGKTISEIPATSCREADIAVLFCAATFEASSPDRLSFDRPWTDSRTCRFVHGIHCRSSSVPARSYPVDDSFQLVELFALFQELGIRLLCSPDERVVVDDYAAAKLRHG